ncbi:hypothetical protein, partial [Cellulomonas sp. 73-92]|uniref:hypothetical protein n=1 Tax=Cellulomonas sp. 73-92 TaxID=1895740 RepID=UPI0025C21906
LPPWRQQTPGQAIRPTIRSQQWAAAWDVRRHAWLSAALARTDTTATAHLARSGGCRPTGGDPSQATGLDTRQSLSAY